MDLGDLRIFRAVVEEGGITRASKKLHRVQSNVTTRIKQLEENLGTKLFIRDGKKLHLSASGRTLLGYAERLLSLAEEARNAVQDPRPQGVFRLGAMESTAAVRLPAPLTEFYRRYPDVDLQLRTGNPTQLAKAILAGDIDAALVAEPIAEEQFESVVAFDEDLVMVARDGHPPIGRRDGSAVDDDRFRAGVPASPKTGSLVPALRADALTDDRVVVLSRHARLRRRRHGGGPVAQKCFVHLPRPPSSERA